MHVFIETGFVNFKRAGALLAVAAVSACSSAAVGPIAGAPSSFVARSYETMASTAAVKSKLGGSALRWENGSSTPTSIALTGNRTGDTKRVALNDGSYVFVYIEGASATGAVTDGTSAQGTVGDARFGGTYAYVVPYDIHYPSSTSTFFTGYKGFDGIITAASDMPSGGSATYTGDVALDKFTHGDPAGTVHYDRGVSRITVDFAAGKADVNLGSFLAHTNGTHVPIPASDPAVTFDQITGSGMAINGAHLTGGTWVTLKAGTARNVIGNNNAINANGTFYGYNPAKSAPAEVAGVFVMDGSTAIITGRFIAK